MRTDIFAFHKKFLRDGACRSQKCGSLAMGPGHAEKPGAGGLELVEFTRK